MISKKMWKKLCAAILCVLFATAAAGADVLFMKDGRIAVGTIVGTAQGGVTYLVTGKEEVFKIEDILRTEKETSALFSLVVDLHLKDGSKIQGKIVDYDAEIGLFLDISFGTLTIPLETIKEIVDPVRRERLYGAPFQARAGGGAYVPLFSSADNFGLSWTALGGATWSLPLMRGLYAGVVASVSGADYKDDDEVKYLLVSMRPEISYKFLGLRQNDGFLGRITPFAAISAGPALISVDNPANDPSRNGDLTAVFGLSLGTELAVAKGFLARFEFFLDIYVQGDSPFSAAGAVLTVGFEP